ncbi:MAG TPA: NAD(P)H-hydrate dehydratase [Candidatus Binatia bacterium]|nr:NAD(P)H-hydrate dehydratase [Candidatus Binatia bacterium]
MKASKPKKLTDAVLRAWPLPDPRDGRSKEDRGRVLIVSGSREIPGAALLVGHAALHAGAGKVQLAVVADAAVAVGVAMPEARVLPVRADRSGQIAATSDELDALISAAGAVVIGPGMQTTPATRRVVKKVMSLARGTLVLDASAIESHRERTGATARILTPHCGEMASLIGKDRDGIEADVEGHATGFAKSSGAVVVLKGPTTCIATPAGRMWIHTGGNVGLGTAGSGDVLSGIIAGLAARGADAEQAAAWGVFLHGRAGEVLARRHGIVGYLARQLSAEVPAIMAALEPK